MPLRATSRVSHLFTCGLSSKILLLINGFCVATFAFFHSRVKAFYNVFRWLLNAQCLIELTCRKKVFMFTRRSAEVLGSRLGNIYLYFSASNSTAVVTFLCRHSPTNNVIISRADILYAISLFYVYRYSHRISGVVLAEILVKKTTARSLEGVDDAAWCEICKF